MVYGSSKLLTLCESYRDMLYFKNLLVIFVEKNYVRHYHTSLDPQKLSGQTPAKRVFLSLIVTVRNKTIIEFY